MTVEGVAFLKVITGEATKNRLKDQWTLTELLNISKQKN